ncbi:MAG: MFS transporter, partial [Paludibacteraceae bacterium]|nr:MFS transporter [Paludibacteraceae bacterium]
LYVDQETDPSMRSSAQGLFMVMTNGIGATIGTLAAQAVVTKNVYSLGEAADFAQVWAGWQNSWYTFAFYALVVAIAFWIFFPKTPVKKG